MEGMHDQRKAVPGAGKMYDDDAGTLALLQKRIGNKGSCDGTGRGRPETGLARGTCCLLGPKKKGHQEEMGGGRQLSVTELTTPRILKRYSWEVGAK